MVFVTFSPHFCGYYEYLSIFCRFLDILWIFLCGYFLWILFFLYFFLFSLGYVELGLEVGESALSLFFLLGVALWPASSLSILNHQTIQLNKLGPPRVFYRTLKISSL